MSVFRIHLISLALYFLCLLLMLSFGITFRGQVIELLVVVSIFITAIIHLATSYKSLKRGRRIYLMMYPAYILIAIILFAVERIALIILLMPFLFFLLPQATHVSRGQYEVRDGFTVMGPHCIHLYKKFFLFEQPIGYTRWDEEKYEGRWSGLEVNESDSMISAMVLVNGKPQEFFFKRN